MVRLIQSHFVPVALNTDRLPDDDTGRIYKALMKRWPQGLWVVTPDGETLSFHYHQPRPQDNYQQNQQRWIADTVKMLEDGARAAGNLPPRPPITQNPYPDRGVGFSKQGVRLAISVIARRQGRQEGPSAIDSVVLKPAEFAAFAPPAHENSFTVPQAVTQKLAPALSPLTDSLFVPRPSDVRTASITGQVLREADGVQLVRYQVRLESAHDRDGNPKYPIQAQASGEGLGMYDPSRRQMRSLLIVLQGRFHNSGTSTATGSIIEWVADK